MSKIKIIAKRKSSKELSGDVLVITHIKKLDSFDKYECFLKHDKQSIEMINDFVLVSENDYKLIKEIKDIKTDRDVIKNNYEIQLDKLESYKKIYSIFISLLIFIIFLFIILK